MPTLIKPVPVKPCGIKLRFAEGFADAGAEMKWPLVNVHFADWLNPILEEIMSQDWVKAGSLYTRGIRCDRHIRGIPGSTSTHSNGLIENDYSHWRDNTVGPLGFDWVKMTLLSTSNVLLNWTIDTHENRVNVIDWLEKRGTRIYHKDSDHHIHLQPSDLKGVV